MKPLSTLQAALVRSVGSLTSRLTGSLVVLIFHRVTTSRDPLLPTEPDAATFSAQMRLLADNFCVLPLARAVDELKWGRLPARAVCVTFDDGYANNFEVALPILVAHKIPATVFVAPGYLNGGRMFNDTIVEIARRAPVELDLRPEGLGVVRLTDWQARGRVANDLINRLKYLEPEERRDAAESIAARCAIRLPDDLMMTDEQVRLLHRAGVEIGAHTVSHPILTRVRADSARREIAESKTMLEAIVGARVTSFAYPNGRPHSDYDVSHVAFAKECGFDCALSTAWGAAVAGSDLWQIPRIAPWDSAALRYGLRTSLAFAQRHPVRV
jgi:peptidoglycan/xylan/chitin deacetylase (PgdA/CDA1 family)